MKYRLLWLIVVAAAGLILAAGCADPVTPPIGPTITQPGDGAADDVVAPAAGARTLTVFAAASLTESFNELGEQFEAAHPDVNILFNFAGSQQLRAQLEQGAQADVFAPANSKEMDAAIASGLIPPDAPQVFAHNQLTAILPAENPGKIDTLADLARPGLLLIVADEAVPAGQYTLAMLDEMSQAPAFGADFKEKVQANVVSREDNVKSVVAKVRLGEADAGIVYSTDAGGAAANDLRLLPIPDEFNQIATYPLAVLTQAPQPELGREFVEYVLSGAGQQILSSFGFIPVRNE